MLIPGTVISYSAGSSGLDPHKYRLIDRSVDRMRDILEVFPSLGPVVSENIPVIIGCYPAALGSFQQGAFVETYLRPNNFIRAMALAAITKSPAIVIAQPLNALRLLLAHQDSGCKLPSTIVFALGGYWCPATLQSAVTNVCRKAGSHAIVMHAYGSAEADFACLVGIDRREDGDILYRRVSKQFSVLESEGRLTFVRTDGVRILTDDRLSATGEHYIILNSERRIAPEVRTALTNFSSDDWSRRTGYLSANDEIHFQLREGYVAARDGEVEHFEFRRKFGMDWLDKPDWGKRGERRYSS